MATKTKAILQRKQLVLNDGSERVEKLGIQAKLYLGYEPLFDATFQQPKLSKVLQDLEIQPFVDSTVEQYKAEKLAEVRAALTEKRKRKQPWNRGSSVRAVWKRTLIQDYN